MVTIDLVYLDTGGGLRASVCARRDLASAQRGCGALRSVQPMRTLDSPGALRRVSGSAPDKRVA
jgi:hypothetical protein